ncbi:MAG: hypothetical protein Q8R92_08590 [Deltaproteobacteria bacterium]|nr:hypothetical protein [Deltaproteobacteria bacterium]
MTEPSVSTDPACTRCGLPAPLTCLACTRPVCGACAIPAPGAATGYGDPTDTDVYFCSLRCEEIYIRIRKA